MTVRGWANLARTLAITLAPVYVVVVIFMNFGFRLESILASILFVQIYILIVQAEAMFRQAEWSRAAYDAVLTVSADVRTKGTIVTIANSGQQPAFNFFVGFRSETEDKPLEHSRTSMGQVELEERDAHMLSPGRLHYFHISIASEEFKKQRIILSITYENVLGHMRDIRAASFENSEEFFMLPFEARPGFLIKAYEDLMLFIRSYQYRKWAKQSSRRGIRKPVEKQR